MTSQETTKITLKPLRAKVLVQKLKQDTPSKGGIILPDSAKKEEIAVVVAVGPGVPDKDGNIRKIPVEPGDKVLLDKYSGQEVELEGEKFIIVKSEEIVAIVG